MNTIGDYLTVLQLGVGLNLVAGAYASHRKDFEEKVGEELERHRDHMDRLLRRAPLEQGAISHDLQDRPVEGLTDRELGRCLGDASVRFHGRVHRYGKRDGTIERLLIPIGLGCALCLVVASIWPGMPIAWWLALILSAVALGPPLYAFVRTSRELKDHEWYYHRQVNDTYAEKVAGRHDARMRSKAVKGEIHRITNQVRVRLKGLA